MEETRTRGRVSEAWSTPSSTKHDSSARDCMNGAGPSAIIGDTCSAIALSLSGGTVGGGGGEYRHELGRKTYALPGVFTWTHGGIRADIWESSTVRSQLLQRGFHCEIFASTSSQTRPGTLRISW
ncbi:unnamed protein product [Amoebophrya sp. A25]|nr:unnamed protein product [Amoebophrya sp. A25]|eukprot:GSA25T00014653001.1